MLDETLIDFIRDRSGVIEVTLETPIFSEGLLDSMAVMEFATFVQEKAGVTFPTADLTLENMDSVERVLAFVEKKKAT